VYEKVWVGPAQAPRVGVTVIVAVIGLPVLFVAVKAFIFPLPEAPNPMVGALFVQA
jgi:hypothetical protein